MKRILTLFTLLAANLLHSEWQFRTVDPMQIPVVDSCGQVPGPSFVGDSTILDNHGGEGNVWRVKSHVDFFDTTVWGPDPELGIGPCEPLPPGVFEIRNSSNQVIMRYVGGATPSEGTWTFYGKVVQK